MNNSHFIIIVFLTDERTIDSVRKQLENKGVKVIGNSSIYAKEVCYYWITCNPKILLSLNEIGIIKPITLNEVW